MNRLTRDQIITIIGIFVATFTAVIVALIPAFLPTQWKCFLRDRYYDQEYQECKPKLPVFQENNGCKHYYELVEEDISWTEANSRAKNKNHRGIPGHLVTIISQKEQEFIDNSQNLRQLDKNNNGEEVFVRGKLKSAWIGASDAINEGIWQWVVGPETENGITFWIGKSDGEPINNEYSNWRENIQPDDGREGEDYGHISLYQEGFKWNDNDVNDRYSEVSQYIVEYTNCPNKD
ncbi:MAG: hypothetical protein F6K39_15715 [Okeania sp. SIO3B3]|nr:hypothetical protein [Okeania sp. SIO3B3]